MLSSEGMTDEEVEKNIIQHWNEWNKPKSQLAEAMKKNQRKKQLETKRAKSEVKKQLKIQEAKLLQENKIGFPKGFWKEPTALIPKDKSVFPDFPNIDGLSKEEADNSIIEFWKKLAEEKGPSIENVTDSNALVFKIKTVFPKGFWKAPTALIPEDKSEFPGFPNTDGLTEEEADNSIIEFWNKYAEKTGSKTVFPVGFWKEPTALIPKYKSEFPHFPNIDGLSMEEADNTMYEFITYFHETCNHELRNNNHEILFVW